MTNHQRDPSSCRTWEPCQKETASRSRGTVKSQGSQEKAATQPGGGVRRMTLDDPGAPNGRIQPNEQIREQQVS